MSPTAKAELKETKPSPEECEPDKKRPIEEEEVDPKKLPARIRCKSLIVDPQKLPPKIKKTQKNPEPDLVTKRRLARAVELSSRGIPSCTDALLNISNAKSNFWTIEGHLAGIRYDTRELVAKLTPEQLQDPEIRRLSNRLQTVARILNKDATEAYTRTQTATEIITDLERLQIGRAHV